MMTNNKPWQAIVNNNTSVKVIGKETSLAIVRKATEKTESSFSTMKAVSPKRYNMDNNGGGYRGL